jgi:hypothetical protein
MVRARIRAAALAIVVPAGLVAVVPAGVAHADICRIAFNSAIHFGPGGCTNPAWLPGVGRRRGAPSQAGEISWPASGGNTWPPSG